jgi:hypothetical protein
MRKIVVLVITALALLAGSPAHGQSFVPSDEAADRAAVNQTRSGKGLSTLALNAQLQAMARGQAVRMAEKGDIYHNPTLGGEATQRGLTWARIGENVGMGPTEAIIYDALLKSPHHYENIVHPTYDSIGVGIVKGDEGRIYLVQVFADLQPQVSAPAPAVKAPAAPAAQPAAQPVAASAPKPAAPVVRAAAPSTPAPAAVDPNAVTGGLVRPVDWQSVLAS